MRFFTRKRKAQRDVNYRDSMLMFFSGLDAQASNMSLLTYAEAARAHAPNAQERERWDRWLAAIRSGRRVARK